MTVKTYLAAQLSESLPNASEAFNIVAISGTVTIPSGTTLGVGDMLHGVKLPAYHKLVDLIVDSDDLDSGVAALVMEAGFIGNGAPIDSPACLIASTTIGQAGGVARASAAGFTKIAPTTEDRIIGLQVTTAAAGATAADTTVQFTLLCRQQSSVYDLGL